MNYQVLDVKVKDTEETAKLYTYFLDNSREIAPERVRPVIVICPGGGYEWVSEREAEPIALKCRSRLPRCCSALQCCSGSSLSDGTPPACLDRCTSAGACGRISY